MNQNKKVYLEAIRIFAVILVIFNHTDGFIYYTATNNIFTYLYSLFFAVFCRSAVPLFFMITGAVLLDREETLSTLLKKRILKILLVLIAVSFAYYAFDMLLGRIEGAGFADFMNKLMTNQIRDSFWFLYAYLFLLLTLPFFRKMAPFLNDKLMLYLVCLKGLEAFIVPLYNLWFNKAVTYDAGFAEGYIYYSLLGYYMSHTGIEQFRKVKTAILGIFLLMLIALNMGIMYLLYQKCGMYQLAGLDFFVFLTAPLLWLIVGRSADKIQNGSKLSRCVVTLGGCVFGIYLFDNLVRWQLLPLYLYLSEKTVGVLACSIYVIFTFVVGFIYTWILKKIPVIRNYL